MAGFGKFFWMKCRSPDLCYSDHFSVWNLESNLVWLHVYKGGMVCGRGVLSNSTEQGQKPQIQRGRARQLALNEQPINFNFGYGAVN